MSELHTKDESGKRVMERRERTRMSLAIMEIANLDRLQVGGQL